MKLSVKPAQNVCVRGNDLFFVSRNYNAFFKYNIIQRELSFCGSIGQLPISEKYPFSSVYYNENSNELVFVPVYATRYVVYSLINKSYSFVETNHTKRNISFDLSMEYGNKIFCIPVWSDESIVVFDMINKREEKEIIIPKLNGEDKSELYRIQKTGESLFLCLLYPQNILIEVDMNEGVITDIHKYDKINGVIDSFYCNNGLFYFHIENSGLIIQTDALGDLNESFDISFNGKSSLIGMWMNQLMVDCFGKEKKYLLDVENRIINTMSDDGFVTGENYTYGVIEEIKSTDNKTNIYISGSGRSIYIEENGIINRNDFMLSSDDEKEFIRCLLNDNVVLKEGECLELTDLFI